MADEIETTVETTVEKTNDEYDSIEFIKDVILLNKYMDEEEAEEYRKTLRKNMGKTVYDDFASFEKGAVALLKKEGKIKD